MDAKARTRALVQKVEDLKEAKREAYAERNKCVAALSQMAQALGYGVGLGTCDPSDRSCDETCNTIVFIDLPTGQVSWRIHPSERPLFSALQPYPGEWDGHDKNEKYVRLLSADYLATPVPRGQVLPLNHL